MARYDVEGVRRAFDVLRELARHTEDVGASDIAGALGMSRSTAFRMLVTLEGVGAVRRHRTTRRYRLGPELIALGRSAGDQLDLRVEARPVMARLADVTGLPVFLNVPGATSVVCVEYVPSRTSIELYGQAGRTLPYHACPSGYVLLASDSDGLLERVLNGPLERFASKTPTTPTQVRAIVDEVRRAGIAYGRDDLDERVSSLAAPILDASTETIASLGIAGFSVDVEPRLNELSVALVAASDEITTHGGGRTTPLVQIAPFPSHHPNEGVLS